VITAATVVPDDTPSAVNIVLEFTVLTPWSRILLEKLLDAQLVKKFSCYAA
jgi:hypothetical protein